MNTRKSLSFLLTTSFVAMAFLTARADSIVFNSLTGESSSTSVNLNTGTAAWAYYGSTNDATFATNTGTPTTDASNLGKFTAFVASTHGSNNNGGVAAFSYTGGVGGDSPSSLSNSTYWEEVQVNGGTTNFFTISSTLFAPTETFDFYLINYDTASDFLVTLLNGATTTATWTQSDVILSGSNGSGATAGELTLTVTGAIGDVLKFQDKENITGVTQTGSPIYTIAGLVAADVQAVPEPSVFASLIAGLGALGVVLRFRRRTA